MNLLDLIANLKDKTIQHFSRVQWRPDNFSINSHIDNPVKQQKKNKKWVKDILTILNSMLQYIGLSIGIVQIVEYNPNQKFILQIPMKNSRVHEQQLQQPQPQQLQLQQQPHIPQLPQQARINNIINERIYKTLAAKDSANMSDANYMKFKLICGLNAMPSINRIRKARREVNNKFNLYKNSLGKLIFF